MRQSPGASSLRQLIEETSTLADQLEAFGQVTDEEFSNLAGGLAELTTQLSRMREQATGLDDILQDRDEDKALSSAYSLCKDSIDLVHASLGIAHSMESQMSEVDKSLTGACSTREDFEKNFLLLRTLSMGFRIEAARVDSEFQGVFTNVAAAIREIDEKIVASTTRAFDDIQTLVANATNERGSLHQDEQSLYSQANASIRMVQDDIEAIRRALSPCVDANLRIGELLTQAQPHMVEALKALQMQDIVRQKLEHVATGFRDIAQHASDQVFIHRAARLQQSHLQTSRQEFERAAHSVTGSLGQLLELGCRIDEQLKLMETAAVEALGRSRVAELFERETLHLTRIADTSEMSNRRIAALVDQIEGVVEVFSRDIGNHEREVKLVALNAQIAAARVGSAGALEKLAEETSMVATRNAATTRTLATNLQHTLDRLRHIKAEADEFLSTVTGEKHAIEEGATTVTKKLVRHRTHIQDHSSAVRTEFSAVHGGIRSLLDCLQFPNTISTTFEPAEALCHAIAAATGGALESHELSQEGAKRFHAHLDRYTMQEERDAHATVLGDAVPAPRRLAPVRKTEDEIELFDDPPSSACRSPSADDDIELFSPQESQEESTVAPPLPATEPSVSPDAATPRKEHDRHGGNGTRPTPPPAAPSDDLGDGIELF